MIDVGSAVGYLTLNTLGWKAGFVSAGKDMQVFNTKTATSLDKLAGVGSALTSIGTSMTKYVTLPLVAMGAYSTKTAIDFESAFTSVRKTVDATEKQFDSLKKGIKDMSKEMPKSASAIAEVASIAGQLGVETKDILSFTKVMMELGDATNLSAEEASSALAKFANITKMSMKDVERLGSTVVGLGNNLATTEADIVSMAQRLAGAGTQVGMSEAQILAFAGAMSSLGIEAEAGGTALSKTMKEIAVMVATGSKELKGFAEVANMSTEDFANLFKEDSTSALLAFIEGLAGLEAKGGSAIATLDDLGIKEIRQSDALLRLSNNTDLVKKSLDLANTSWSENTALAKEAGLRYDTTASKLAILKNKFDAIAINIGDRLLPSLIKTMDNVDSLLGKWDALDEGTKSLIITIAKIVAIIGPILLIIGKLITAIVSVIQFVGLIGEAITALTPIFTAIGTAIAGLVGAVTLPVIIIVAIIAGLIAIFVVLWNKCDAFRNFWIDLWNSIVSGTKSAFNSIKGFFENFGSMIEEFIAGLGTFFSNIKTFFANAIDSIKELFTGIVDGIKQFFSDAYNGIKLFLENAISGTKQFLTNAVDNIKQFFSDALNTLLYFFNNFPYLIGYALGYVVTTIVLFANKIREKAIDIAKNFVETIVNFWVTLPQRIAEVFFLVVNAIITFKDYIIQSAIEIGTNFINNIINFWQTLPQRAVELFNFVVASILAFKDSAIAFAQELGSRFVDTIIFLLVTLPFKIIALLLQVVNAIIAFKNSVIQKAMEIGQQFVNTIINFWQTLPERIAKIFAFIIQLGANLSKDMYNVAVNLWQGFLDGLNNMWGKIESWFKEKIQAIKDFIQGIKDGIKDATKASEKGSSSGGSYANGLSYVPYDGFKATLHEGEQILTKNQATDGTGGTNGNTFIFNSPEPIDEYKAKRLLKETIEQLEDGML